MAENHLDHQHSAGIQAQARTPRVIYLLLAATFVVILNETIMSVALPHLMADLHVDAPTVQWVSTAFMLTMAVVIPITGYLLQRFQTRPIFTAAMVLFSAGTLIAAAAPGFGVLLLGRVVQAGGTAIMLPLLMTTVLQLVPPAHRGKVMGNISIIISVAPAIGPTISGVILNFLSWRWMFIFVLPIALAMLVVGMRQVANVGIAGTAPLDVPSVILAAFGFGGLVYGLSQVGAAGSALPMLISLGVGALGLVAFVLRQLRLQKKDHALLDLRTFHQRIFTLSIVMMAVSMMALFGTIIVLPIYLQNVLHLDALSTGLLVLPGGLLMGLAAPFVGRLYDKVGPRPLLVPGSIVVSVALWSLTLVSDSTPAYLILAAHLVLSLGLAMVFTPLFTVGLGALPPHLYSHGSAIVGTVQQVAGAAGAALFVTIMAAQTHVLAGSGSADAAAAGGVRLAFLMGAVVSLFAVVAAFFINKPADAGQSVHGGPEAEPALHPETEHDTVR
ncbi:MDR family MFS transporter [Pseudarthrobacter sp. P1]|uniref:MDR family MFS transporter n=1 Tax=Pseudarthrobacter sp. P1 TaxID=3418418 RepID=UPI003CED21CB